MIFGEFKLKFYSKFIQKKFKKLIISHIHIQIQIHTHNERRKNNPLHRENKNEINQI